VSTNAESNRRLFFRIFGATVLLMLIVTAFLFKSELDRIRGIKAQRASVVGELPDFRLRDQAGETVTRSGLSGHVLIVSFGSLVCRGACSGVAGQMAVLQEGLKPVEDVRWLTISIGPEIPEDQLAAYGREVGADPDRWKILTGEADRIRDLIETGFKASVEHDEAGAHDMRLAVVDRKGRIRAYLDAGREEILEDVAPIIRRLFAEN